MLLIQMYLLNSKQARKFIWSVKSQVSIHFTNKRKDKRSL